MSAKFTTSPKNVWSTPKQVPAPFFAGLKVKILICLNEDTTLSLAQSYCKANMIYFTSFGTISSKVAPFMPNVYLASSNVNIILSVYQF